MHPNSRGGHGWLIDSVCYEGSAMAPLIEMLFYNFYSRIKKLNKDLWVDTDHRSSQRDPEYPTMGLYASNRFLMGIPSIEVPEYSVSALDFSRMSLEGRQEELKEAIRTGYHREEKFLWRGWRAIICGLIRQGYCTKEKAEKVFDTHFNPKQTEFPRNFIDRQI